MTNPPLADPIAEASKRVDEYKVDISKYPELASTQPADATTKEQPQDSPNLSCADAGALAEAEYVLTQIDPVMYQSCRAEIHKVIKLIRHALSLSAASGDDAPELLTEEEKAQLLKKAEHLWADLQANNLGGYSGINRPFWIMAAFKEVIEEFGKRDVGLHWSQNDLASLAAAPGQEGGADER